MSMPESCPNDDIVHVFLSCLSNQYLLTKLEDVPSSLLPQEARSTLQKIALRFCDLQEKEVQSDEINQFGSEHVGSSRAPATRGPNKRKRTDCGTPRNPWGTFQKLEKLEIPTHLRGVLSSSTALEFVNEQYQFRNEAILAGSEASSGDIVLRCLKWTTQLEQRQFTDRLRWLFAMLMFYDLVKILWPELSGRRVSPQMKVELIQKFESKLKASLEGAGLTVEWAAENTAKWCLEGSKIDTFCEKFGVGCLLYIGQYISEDFLRNKFTKSGLYFKDAIVHLESLRLKELAEESGANHFAGDTRRILSERFVCSV